MTRIFDLCLASDTIAADAQQLGVSVEALKSIGIQVRAEIVQQPALYLQLTYHITLPSQALAVKLDWPAWQASKVGFDDYLWRESCLECFITGHTVSHQDIVCTDHAAPYIEINASPDGRYALYQFVRYRYPAVLPPVPLYHADGHTRASIDWNSDPTPKPSITNRQFFCKSFAIPLAQLQSGQYAIENTIVTYIHPCVILWFGTTALYFATSHATPPDFHDRHHWSTFAL